MNSLLCLFEEVASTKDNLLKALDISWKGILAIFIVITIVCVASVSLNAICTKLANKKAEKEAEKQNDSNQ